MTRYIVTAHNPCHPTSTECIAESSEIPWLIDKLMGRLNGNQLEQVQAFAAAHLAAKERALREVEAGR